MRVTLDGKKGIETKSTLEKGLVYSGVISQCCLKTYSGLDSALGIVGVTVIKYKFVILEELPL